MAGLMALCAAYVLSQFYRAFLAVLTPDLIAELGATNADLSLASGMWFFTFAAMQFAVGISLDRYGPRRTAGYLLGVAGGAGVLLFAFAWSPMTIIVAMGLIGIGCAPVLMASLFIFSYTFSPLRFATLTSVFIGIGTLGNVAGATPLALAAEAFGWRAVVLTFAIMTIFVAGAILMLVQDPETDKTSGEGGLKGFVTLLKMPVLWMIFPAMLLNYSAAAGIRGLWAGPMLIDIYAADAATIGLVTLFMALAMSAGSFIYGPLDTLFNSRKWVALSGMVIGVLAMIYLAVAPGSGLVVVTTVFIIIGITGMVYGVIMAHAKAFFPVHLTGRGITLMNFFSIGGVSLMQIATGSVVSNTGGDATNVYSALFWFYVAAYTLPIAVYAFSRDAKPR